MDAPYFHRLTEMHCINYKKILYIIMEGLNHLPAPPDIIFDADFTHGMDVYILGYHFKIEGIIRDGQYVLRHDGKLFISRSDVLDTVPQTGFAIVDPTPYIESIHGPIYAVPDPEPETFVSRYKPIEREEVPEFRMDQHVFVGTHPYAIVGKLDHSKYVLRSIASGGAGGGNVWSSVTNITNQPSDIDVDLENVPRGSPILPLTPLPNEDIPQIEYQELRPDSYKVCLKRNDNTYLACLLKGISSLELSDESKPFLQEGNLFTEDFVETDYFEDPEMLAKYEENEIYAAFVELEGDGPEAVSIFRPFDDTDENFIPEVRVTINIKFPEKYVVILEVEEDDRYSLKRIFESKYHTGVPTNTFQSFRCFPYQKLATITRLEPGECILTNGIRVPLSNMVNCHVGEKVIIQKELEEYYFIRSADGPPPPPPLLERKHSGQTSDQGQESSCCYHVIAKMIIKNVFKKFFYLDPDTEDTRVASCSDLFDTFRTRPLVYRDVYARAGRKGAVNIILFQLIYNMYYELRNPDGAFRAPGTEINLLAVLYHSILAPNSLPGPIAFMGPIQRCTRFDGLYQDSQVQQVAYDLLTRLREKVHHEKFKFIQIRVAFSPALNDNERFHATLRELLSKGLYVSITGKNKTPTALHAKHALLLIEPDHGKNYLIKNSWKETRPFSSPLTDIIPPDYSAYNFTTQYLDFLIPCPNEVFEKVFSTLRETDPPTSDATHVQSNPALSARYGFYELPPEDFITTMTVYFQEYDAFSATLKDTSHEFSQYGRRYSVNFDRTVVTPAVDEVDAGHPRELTEALEEDLKLEPERGGKRTRNYTLRKSQANLKLRKIRTVNNRRRPPHKVSIKKR